MLEDILPGTAYQLRTDQQHGLHTGGQLSIRRGQLDQDFAFGEITPGDPMTAEHRMLWLSASKPLTAVAIAQLWQQKLLDFDDPVAKHIPEFAIGGKDGITIRHLLTHTSGIRMISTGWPELSWPETIAKICARRIEPNWVPGEKAGYHLTSSWFILGEILQRLTGIAFPRYLQKQIFEPTGMDHTLLGMEPETYKDQRHTFAPVLDTEHDAQPHPWTQQEYLVQPSPGANAIGPTADLASFYLALLQDVTDKKARLLKAETVGVITDRHRHRLYDHTFKAHLDWGLGFILSPTQSYAAGEIPYAYGPSASAASFGHSGYRSVVAFADPQEDLVVALAWNGTAAESDHRRRVHHTLEALYRDLREVA